jgi:hypothetical protein
MIGVCAERLYWRISPAVSKPSMSGMLTSSRITANSRCRISFSASLPEPHADDLVAEVLEDGAEDEQLLRQVVDDQDARAFVARIAQVVELRVAQHNQPLSTASRCIGSTGLDR